MKQAGNQRFQISFIIIITIADTVYTKLLRIISALGLLLN